MLQYEAHMLPPRAEMEKLEDNMLHQVCDNKAVEADNAPHPCAHILMGQCRRSDNSIHQCLDICLFWFNTYIQVMNMTLHQAGSACWDYSIALWAPNDSP